MLLPSETNLPHMTLFFPCKLREFTSTFPVLLCHLIFDPLSFVYLSCVRDFSFQGEIFPSVCGVFEIKGIQ